MSRRNGERHPQEQSAAERLLAALGASSTEDGIQKAQALTGAVMAEPLVMTIAINRSTGRLTMAANVSTDLGERQAEDLKMLHEAMLVLSRQIAEQMVVAAGQKTG